jgi:cytochrome c-type protein NapB
MPRRLTLLTLTGVFFLSVLPLALASEGRAKRRAYEGAPPVIPHENFGMRCVSCHNNEGLEVAGVGYAPPLPHARTPGMSQASRCLQCHVFVQDKGLFKPSEFDGLAPDLRKGDRAFPGAPPRIPHPIFMREDCLACHGGPAAREEIRSSHSERKRCLQCHVPITTSAEKGEAGEI